MEMGAFSRLNITAAAKAMPEGFVKSMRGLTVACLVLQPLGTALALYLVIFMAGVELFDQAGLRFFPAAMGPSF